ncbi:hypothetical protein [Gordonia sp. NPDC003429]
MPNYPTDDHGLIHRAEVIAVGFTDDDLRRSLREGDIVRITRGVYVVGATRSRREWHRVRALAAVSTSTISFPLSHQSAAVLHGIEMLMPDFRRVHTVATTGKGYRTAMQHCHGGDVDDADIVRIRGVAVTSVERTAVDVACAASGFAQALAVFDSALRHGADRSAMASMLTSRRRGVAMARRALHFADAGAENPGESWSRAEIIEAGLPVARLQHDFYDGDQHVARSDFDWQGRSSASSTVWSTTRSCCGPVRT